jgi:predicted type IV restriction endonuclease
MELQEHLQDIKVGLKLGRYSKEEGVKQGIILRILSALSWNCWDTKTVCPEYSVGSGRVDYALCNNFGQPLVFIEAKDIGKQNDNSEEQLMKYSFEKGVPMAILTDGKEWSFYLPTQIGDYQDRRIYKLNLLERENEECSFRLSRYLDYQKTMSGETIKMAHEDYKNQRNKKIVEQSLPEAWKRLVEERDEILIDLLANSVEDICGFKPDNEMIIDFLDEKINIVNEKEPQKAINRPINKATIKPAKQSIDQVQIDPNAHFLNEDFKGNKPYAFVIQGQRFNIRNWQDIYARVIDYLNNIDTYKIANLPNNPDFISNRNMRYFSDKESDLRVAKKVTNTIYAEVNLSANSIKENIARLLKLFNIDSAEIYFYWN